MAQAAAPKQEREPGAKMTMRVYSMSRSGEVTEDRGTVSGPIAIIRRPAPHDRCTGSTDPHRWAKKPEPTA